jgi:LytS/YehU family sensor histidine kinase
MIHHEISIKAGKTGDQLEVMIEELEMEHAENLVDKKENGVLFDITKERLSHLYGERQSMTVQWQPAGGVQVKIQIPFREMIVESEETFIVESAL